MMKKLPFIPLRHLKGRLLFACIFLLLACQGPKSPQVVVYTSVDQVYAEQVLQAFEEQTGIRVLAVYDVEATKTVGLAQRLLAEKANPQADVFWNGEFLQTLFLDGEGVLTPARIPEDSGLPAAYIDPEGRWAAFGGRSRVILINTERVAADQSPTSIFDLLSADYPPQTVALAKPLFGTTSTEAAALYATLGADAAREFYRQVAARGVRVLDGNSVVRDQVASGQLAWGLTDTDDACGAILRGAPVQMIFPDQEPGQIGTLIIPNTVALIAGGPNPEAGQILFDYLLSAEAETLLVDIGWIQVPTRPLASAVEPDCFVDVAVRSMDVDFDAIYGNLATTLADLQGIFVQ